MASEDLVRIVESARDEIISLHQGLIRIPTINTGRIPTGNEKPAAELLAGKLRAEGIPAEVYESAPGRGNLVARLPGKTGSPRLLYMAHLDVVPVENESAWLYPPFSGTLADGRIWGRGASDDKAHATTATMALVLLKRAGVQLDGDLIFSACADEESGGRYGVGWMVENYPDLMRADWAVNEGGGNPIHTPSGLAYAFNVGEKGRLEVHITLRGTSAHAAHPWRGDNVLMKAAAALQRLGDYRPELDTSLSTFAEMARLYGLPTLTPHNLDQILSDMAERYPNEASTLRGLSRMTLTPTVLQAGVKSNSVPETAYLTCDVRTLPWQDDVYVREQVRRLLADIPGTEIEIEYTAVSNSSPYESPFVPKALEAARLALGGREFRPLPMLTIGFTDSRFLRPLGTQVYDFWPLPPEAELNAGIHGSNEFVEVETLLFQVRYLLALAQLALGGTDRTLDEL